MSTEDLKDFLRSRGAPDDVVTGGARSLVERWERIVEDVRHGYPLGLDDYLDDLDARQLLDELVTAFPETLNPTLRQRLAKADLAMRAAGVRAPECLWGRKVAQRAGWTPERQWWYFTLPRDPGPELREELGK